MHGEIFPSMWNTVKEFELNQALIWGGETLVDCHTIFLPEKSESTLAAYSFERLTLVRLMCCGHVHFYSSQVTNWQSQYTKA